MILITGANGFIGSSLVWALNERGRTDLVLCDRQDKLNGRHNLEKAQYHSFVDIQNLFSELKKAPWRDKVEAILHMGACADTTEMNEKFLQENNVTYSQKLCEWSLDQGARFIYASSASVYGDGTLGFSDDDALTPQLKPLNPYGRSKWEVDKWILEKNLSDKVAGLRFFNVFGPNEYHKGSMASVIYRAFPMAHDLGKVRLFQSHKEGVANGEQERDFIYIKDVNKVVLFFLDNPKANGLFNVGTGKASTFNQLGQSLLQALGKKPEIEYFEMPESLRAKYQYFTQADIRRLREAGYQEPFTSFESAVTDYVQNYLLPNKVLTNLA